MDRFTEAEQEQFDKWTKLQIYDAYLLERDARLQLNKNFRILQRHKAEIMYRIRELKKDCDEKYR